MNIHYIEQKFNTHGIEIDEKYNIPFENEIIQYLKSENRLIPNNVIKAIYKDTYPALLKLHNQRLRVRKDELLNGLLDNEVNRLLSDKSMYFIQANVWFDCYKSGSIKYQDVRGKLERIDIRGIHNSIWDGINCAFVSHRWFNEQTPFNDNDVDAVRQMLIKHYKKPGDVLLWIDYSCLPQGNKDNVEKFIFKRGLNDINKLLSKLDIIITWRQQDSYRGWCRFEYILSNLMNNDEILNFFIYKPKEIYSIEPIDCPDNLNSCVCTNGSDLQILTSKLEAAKGTTIIFFILLITSIPIQILLEVMNVIACRKIKVNWYPLTWYSTWKYNIEVYYEFRMISTVLINLTILLLNIMLRILSLISSKTVILLLPFGLMMSTLWSMVYCFGSNDEDRSCYAVEILII